MKQGFRLVDFEHAGLGDAAFDLALFSARTPLTDHQELAVLDAYLDETSAPAAVAERFFAFKPAAEVLGAAAGAVDVVDVASGDRPVVGLVKDVVRARLPAVDAALSAVLGEPTTLFTKAKKPKRGSR